MMDEPAVGMFIREWTNPHEAKKDRGGSYHRRLIPSSTGQAKSSDRSFLISARIFDQH